MTTAGGNVVLTRRPAGSGGTGQFTAGAPRKHPTTYGNSEVTE